MEVFVLVVLGVLVVGALVFFILLFLKKEIVEKRLLEAQKDTFKSRCIELVPILKTRREYFRLWRSLNHIDLERDEAHDTNYIWDGFNGVILIENDYAISGSRVVGRAELETFVGQLSPKGLKNFAETLEGVSASAA